MRFLGLLAACVMLTSVACGPQNNSQTVYSDSGEPIAQVDKDDPEMAAAEAHAKKELDYFIEELAKPGQREFSLKTALPADNGSNEHIWVDRLTYANGVFHGRLNNEPYNIKSRKINDPVTVRREDVEDWIIMDGETMLGGYTAKLLMDREMSTQKTP